MVSDPLRRLPRAWLLTAIIDGTFSSVLTVFFYKGTFAQLWQRVASTLLGPTAAQGGTRTVLIGILMHLCVALTWSTVFLLLVIGFSGLRRALGGAAGILAVAAIYGPLIWMTMSLIVIPFLTGRPPVINNRWWIQFFGHIPFVAIPIVASIASGAKPRSANRSSLSS